MSRGFILRDPDGESPLQTLGYRWQETDGTCYEFSFRVIGGNDPMIVAIELKNLAAAIQQRHRDHEIKAKHNKDHPGAGRKLR